MSDSGVPKPDWKDNTITVAKLVGSAVPFAGGPIVELLNIVNDRTLLGKRVMDFLDGLNKVVTAHGHKLEGLAPEKLAQNEAFVTTLLHAVQAATRSHQKEKLNALRNAVLNSALPSAPDEDMQLIFINLLDSMTASHLKLLLFLDDPKSYFPDEQERAGPTYPYLERAFPGMDGTFYRVILNDLKAKDLANIGLGTREDNPLRRRTTGLGYHFVQFIKSPIEDTNEDVQKG